MVCCAGRCADLGEMPYEPPERWTVRQQNGKVEQPQSAAVGRGARTRTFVKRDKRRITAMCAKHRMRAVAAQQAQPECRLVERE